MRIVLIVVAALVAVVALAYGAIFFYANVINDSPDELDEGDLADALEATSTIAVDGTAARTRSHRHGGRRDCTHRRRCTDDRSVSAGRHRGDRAGRRATTATGCRPTASTFGYRVEEVLAGVNTTAVGRSNEISGLMTIAGTTIPVVDIEVQVASITSDESRRDGAFTGRIMSADEFPTATFTLTQPIELGAVPADGEEITASATGDLTLRGVTNSVTFDVTAQANGQLIGVLGSIPVLFSDYGIDNPSFAGVTTEDNGLVEFVLVFEPA